jgi:uncharacterized membrane protein
MNTITSGENPVHSEFKYGVAEMGALAHLYRGEMYRSKIWRTRLDTTTNWAVATSGIALSVAFSSAEISPVPLLLVGLLVIVFLVIEARRYRYFDIWRTRVRLMEVCFYGPILKGEPISTANLWNEVLAHDYVQVRFHISSWEAAGRRLRRNYIWIFIVLGMSYLAKLSIHPVTLSDLGQLWERAAIGPLPGQLVLVFFLLFFLSMTLMAVLTTRVQHAAGRVSGPQDQDPLDKYGIRI